MLGTSGASPNGCNRFGVKNARAKEICGQKKRGSGQKRRGSGQKVHFGGQKAKFAGKKNLHHVAWAPLAPVPATLASAPLRVAPLLQPRRQVSHRPCLHRFPRARRQRSHRAIGPARTGSPGLAGKCHIGYAPTGSRVRILVIVSSVHFLQKGILNHLKKRWERLTPSTLTRL